MSGQQKRVALLGMLLLIAVATPVTVWLSTHPTQSAFTDVEELGENRLGSARLDIVVGNTSVSLSADNIAPGDRLDGTIVLNNDGDLPLRYRIVATVSGAEFAPWVKWWLAEPVGVDCQQSSAITTPTVIASGTSIELIGTDPGPRSLLAGGGDVVCIFDVEA